MAHEWQHQLELPYDSSLTQSNNNTSHIRGECMRAPQTIQLWLYLQTWKQFWNYFLYIEVHFANNIYMDIKKELTGFVFAQCIVCNVSLWLKCFHRLEIHENLLFIVQRKYRIAKQILNIYKTERWCRTQSNKIFTLPAMLSSWEVHVFSASAPTGSEQLLREEIKMQEMNPKSLWCRSCPWQGSS